MAGLLDFLNSDDARLGMGLMAAGGPQTDPSKTSWGGMLESAMGSVDAYKKQQMANQLAQSQIAENLGNAQSKLATARQAQMLAAARANAFNPDGSVNPQAASLLFQAGEKPEDIMKFGDLGNLGRPKVEGTFEQADPNTGAPMVGYRDAYGRQIGPLIPKPVAPIQQDTGNQLVSRDPYTGRVYNTAGKTVTPGEQLSATTSLQTAGIAADTARGNKLLDLDWEHQKALQQQQTMTEDQRRTVQPLLEAEYGLKNMLAVGVDDKGNLKPAAYAGLGDQLNRVGLSMLGNFATGEERQRFNSASATVSDALLRAATGAGMNKDEAQRAVIKYVPALGDSDEVKKQKLDALPGYIEGLRQRVGPQAAAITQTAMNMPPVVNLQKPGAAPAPPTADASKFVTVNGTQMMARKAPDGRYYVKDPSSKSGWSLAE